MRKGYKHKKKVKEVLTEWVDADFWFDFHTTLEDLAKKADEGNWRANNILDLGLNFGRAYLEFLNDGKKDYGRGVIHFPGPVEKERTILEFPD